MTEKNTNLIDTYEVDDDTGLASGPSRAARRLGATPFGFGFDKRERLIVSEAFGGVAGRRAPSPPTSSRTALLDPITAPRSRPPRRPRAGSW